MRKLLILIGLFLTLSLSGQIMPGVVESQTVVAAAACDDGMLNNGCFNDGDTGWTDEANFIIADGVATFNDVASASITQAAADMETPMGYNTGYTVSFTYNHLTGTTINLTVRDAQDYTLVSNQALTVANDGATLSYNFTTPASGNAEKGLRITISSSSTGTCSIDNIKLVAQ